jgi:hypothetical protein
VKRNKSRICREEGGSSTREITTKDENLEGDERDSTETRRRIKEIQSNSWSNSWTIKSFIDMPLVELSLIELILIKSELSEIDLCLDIHLKVILINLYCLDSFNQNCF